MSLNEREIEVMRYKTLIFLLLELSTFETFTQGCSKFWYTV